LVLAVLLGAPAAAVEVEPLFRVRLLGGQYFFGAEKGTLNGNLAALAAPALIFNDRWTVLPSASGKYQGTKQVVDLVGAGSIFQEQMDYRFGTKALYRPEGSKWRFKGALSHKLEFLKETRDEVWNQGLFDYQTFGAGLEAEWLYQEPFSVRAAYDFGYTFFPNYSSLESEAALDFQGKSLARELVGDRVLDAYIHLFSFTGSAALGKGWTGDASLGFQFHSFPNQPVVQPTGLLSADKRSDFLTSISARVRRPVEIDFDWRLVGSLGVSFTNALSDQNSYDALRTEFFDDYYDYRELSVHPELRSLFGDERQPVAWSIGFLWKRRIYPNRRVQDPSGSYGALGVSQRDWMLDTTLSYPMAPRWSVLLNLQHGRTSSNQGFEQFYSYNYTATNYLFGVSYDY